MAMAADDAFPAITKSGDMPIKVVGQTMGTKYGTNPLAKMRDESVPVPMAYDK